MTNFIYFINSLIFCPRKEQMKTNVKSEKKEKHASLISIPFKTWVFQFRVIIINMQKWYEACMNPSTLWLHILEACFFKLSEFIIITVNFTVIMINYKIIWNLLFRLCTAEGSLTSLLFLSSSFGLVREKTYNLSTC